MTTTQTTETLASLRDHYTSAIQAGDTDRAMGIAGTYRQLTDRLISEDLDSSPESWKAHYNRRFREMLADGSRYHR